MRKHLLSIASLLISACLILSACSTASNVDTDIDPSIAASYSEIPIQTQAPEVAETPSATDAQVPFSLDSIQEFSGQAYVEINNNIPYFTDDDYNLQPFEHYSELDALGRCGTAFACISTELMPTEERGSIGQVKPSGWHTVKYDCVDGKYLYNRCHLIGYQLTAENANTCNLITGTRYMNVEGMLPFENMVADYIKETGNHVLYRVTPIYTGDNLVADGVEMEAKSVEDDGDGVSYHVFVYNEQPGVVIDHATGESHLAEDTESYADQEEDTKPYEEYAEDAQTEADAEQEQAVASGEYVLNTNTMKFHRPDCSSVNQMSDANKWEYHGTRDEVTGMGYEPCKRCNP